MSAAAAPIRIFHEGNIEKAHTVKNIFSQNYQIPEELIVLKLVSNCGDLKGKGKLDVCLNNNGDLIIVSVDRGFVNESLKIFWAP